jgi:N-acetylated-alpha-linked acidic dipeptidase
MNRSGLLATMVFAAISLAPAGTHVVADEQPLAGYSAESSRAEKQWEEKMKAIPDPDKIRAYVERMSARPHHVGSPYDKDNAEWILA